MTHTQRHLAFAAAWLFGLPLLVLPLFVLGAFPPGELHSVIWSVVWGLGLVGAFASWAIRDASAHGKSVYWAVLFTAAWFVVFCLAAIPYLFVTRGLREGALASLRYAAFVLACGGGWILIALLARLFFSVIGGGANAG
jgi:hypothetical protein